MRVGLAPATRAAGTDSVSALASYIWSRPRWSGRAAKVSVIVPTVNRAGHLPATVGSIFQQTIDIHELLLVDDGSTDETPQVVSALLAENPGWRGRLKYFRQTNRGKSAALNVGLEHASGDWIAFNDSDDRWLPVKLALQFTALGRYERANACFTDVRFVNNTTLQETAFQMARVDRTFPFGTDRCVSHQYLRKWPGIYMQSILVARETLKRVGPFDARLRMSMDVDFGFRLGLASEMCYVNRPLVEVDRTIERGVGLTTEYPPECIERAYAQHLITANWLTAARRSHPELRRPLESRAWGEHSALANHYLQQGDIAQARRILYRAVRLIPHPRSLAKFVWSVLSPRSLRREIMRREARRLRT